MSNRMLARLFFLPAFFFVLSRAALPFLAGIVPDWFSHSAMLKGVGESSRAVAPWVGAALVLVALALFIVSMYRLWRWQQGKSDSCSICGGLVDQKYGRYGPYKHCLSCGKNQKI